MPRTKLLKTRVNESKGRTAHFDEYKVRDDDTPVFMTLFPGDTGQSSLTDVILDGNKLKVEVPGVIEDFSIGTNRALNGKFLEIYTLITDVPGDPDLTSVDFSLMGGEVPYNYYMEKTVQDQGDSVGYKVTIFFFR